jgi:hypothetical protein
MKELPTSLSLLQTRSQYGLAALRCQGHLRMRTPVGSKTAFSIAAATTNKALRSLFWSQK